MRKLVNKMVAKQPRNSIGRSRMHAIDRPTQMLKIKMFSCHTQCGNLINWYWHRQHAVCIRNKQNGSELVK